MKKETTKANKPVKKVVAAKAKKVVKTEKPVKPVKATKTVKAAVPVKKAEVKAPAKEAKVDTKPLVAKAPRGKKIKNEDTGSVDFQINNFSQKINLLAKHLKTHPHDFDSRRGLLIMVGKRRRLLNYVKKSDLARYEVLAKSLKLKA